MYRRILILCCVFLVAPMQTGCIGMVVLSPEECKNETPRTDINVFFADSTPTPPTQGQQVDALGRGAADSVSAEW
jgi:hypothetical protein